MAGEDPSVAVIGLVIDSARKVADIIANAAKSFFSGIMDIVKTGTFLYFRMKMNRNQNPAADLKHGIQSLQSLRHHEALGAQLVTVEIGDDRHAKQILKSELKKTEIDFAISKHEGTYFLHYKKDNEQDVALAQAFALRRLHGEPEQNHGNERADHKRDRVLLGTQLPSANAGQAQDKGSSSGKTRFYIKPNLMQLHSSYVITDPKGTLYGEMAGMFELNGYQVRVFNTVDMSRSCCFKPLAYITSETDILEIVNCLVENTKGKGEKPILITMRLIQIYLYIAISPIPIATFPSNEYSQIGKSFPKSFLAVCLQGALIFIVVRFMPTILGTVLGGIGNPEGGLNVFFAATLYSIALIVTLAGTRQMSKRICGAL